MTVPDPRAAQQRAGQALHAADLARRAASMPTYAETLAAMDAEIAEAIARIEARWVPMLRAVALT